MSMIHHPKHLHGRFFRVLNTQGEYSPLKHSVDVAPDDDHRDQVCGG
jgi:FtsP/CotA-like multicopper oxidase with cupredoxin domain